MLGSIPSRVIREIRGSIWLRLCRSGSSVVEFLKRYGLGDDGDIGRRLRTVDCSQNLCL